MIFQNDEEKLEFIRLIGHRRIKPKLIELLKDAKEKIPAGDKLRAAGSLTRAELADELQKAVQNQWLIEKQIAATLAQAELAGNQHILLFELPGSNDEARKEFLQAIGSPSGAFTKATTVRHFLTVPRRSSYQIVSSDASEVTVKFVAEREYWTENILDESDSNRIVYEKVRHSERCPVIVKASLPKKLIEVRVSPRQKGDSGSARNHHDFAIRALSGHYALDDATGWFQKMTALPISNAFPKIVNDTALLIEMWADSPEDRNVASRFRNQGRPKLGRDLRRYKHWDHANGYARKSVSGFFRCGPGDDQVLYARLHDDKIPKAFGRDRISRMFISRFCTDEEIEHAISAIRAHL